MPVLNVIFIANKTDQFTTQTHLHITFAANDRQASFVGVEIAIIGRMAISFEVWQEGSVTMRK